MKAMFAYVAYNSNEWKIDGLENFNFKNVTVIEIFLDSYNITMRDLGTLDLYHINSNFLGNNNAIKLTINLHENPDTYTNLFDSNTAKDSNSEIIINYTSNVNIDDIIDNVPLGSHIIKGVLIEE